MKEKELLIFRKKQDFLSKVLLVRLRGVLSNTWWAFWPFWMG